MFCRSINLPKSHSFFLFGARGTGKTALLKSLFHTNTLYIDLLNLDKEAQYQLDPESLYKEISALPTSIKTIIIDEIQKVPKLLDVVHRTLEERKTKQEPVQFILTGSSARKLKQGSANLLAGRAFVFHLFPLTCHELGKSFNLEEVLAFGSLPQAINYKEQIEKRRFLKAYTHTYLKEEIWGEQLIRKIEPFRKFLQIAAQSHGQIINYSKIARDIGVDANTVKNYYTILEDTLLGFLLPAYQGSIRKQLKLSPKFFLFDNGVKRTLENMLDFPLTHGSFEYGEAFESFIIYEIRRQLSYLELDYNFSYMASDGGAEVDLLISQGQKVKIMLEIKSAKSYKKDFIRHIKSFHKDFSNVFSFLLYDGETAMEDEGIHIRPWQDGITEIIRLLS